jgi:hypothetical protein
MSEPGDWEPLSADELAQRPGERAAQSPAKQSPAKQSPVNPAPPKETAPAANPDGERLLQELKARIAQAPPSKSLIDEVMHREQRARRQQRAAGAEQLAGCKPVQSAVAVKDLPLDVDFDAGEHGRDAREDQAWFKDLPEDERKRLQEAWAQKRVKGDDDFAVQRRIRNRRTAAAIITFVAVLFAGSGQQWHATVGAGICCGIWWRHASPDRLRDPLIAFACLLVLHLLAWGVLRGDPPYMLWMDSVLVVALAAFVGFDGEIRRTGGFEAN